jgi:hypothetical protein
MSTKDHIVSVRMSDEERKRIEAWAAEQPHHPKLAGAIRQLAAAAIDHGFSVQTSVTAPKPPVSPEFLKLVSAYREAVGAASDDDALRQIIKRAESTFDDPTVSKAFGDFVRALGALPKKGLGIF